MIHLSSTRWAAAAIAAVFLVSSPAMAGGITHQAKVAHSVHKKPYKLLKSLFHKNKKHGSHGPHGKPPRCQH